MQKKNAKHKSGLKWKKKKILRKRSKNQHLKLKIVSFSWFQRLIFFTSFSCALIRSHVFCEFSWFQNAIDFFSSLFLCVLFVLFPLSQSVLILCYTWLCNHFIRFALMTELQQEKNSYSYRFVFLPQFVSVFNFEFAKCIRFQSILSSISR